MVEEFHGIRNADNVITDLKQLYGWGTLNANVWLPSMCELVGYTGNVSNAGTYYPFMQGLNASTVYWVDPQGGTQFLYFRQYNTSGGGQKLWEACSQQQSWLRSCVHANDFGARAITGEKAITGDLHSVTTTHAVHPAVSLRL